MVIVQMSGGLGNQFFSYAAGRSLASARRTEVRLDLSHYNGAQREPELVQFKREFKLSKFNIKAAIASEDDVRRVRDRFRGHLIPKAITGILRPRVRRFPFGHFRENTLNYDPVFPRLPNDTYLEGFFQSESYFLSIADEIRSELTPVDYSISQYAQRFVSERKRDGQAVISLHVRRGDIAYSAEILKKTSLLYGKPLPVEYFAAAMARFEAKSHFLVFSDDLEWCRNNLKADEIEFVEGHSDLQDFELMRACDHQITANSTFSWWAAWLNRNPNKRILAPRQWFTPGKFPNHRIESLMPPQWELL